MRSAGSLAALVTVAQIAAVGPARAAPAGYGGAKHLGPAQVYLALKPEPLYDLVDEARKAASEGKGALLVNMMIAGLQRSLGFDASTRAWLARGGVDPAAPVLVSIGSVDLARLRAATRRAADEARKHVAKRASGESGYFDLRKAAGAPVLIGDRLVVPLADAAKARAFGDGIAAALGGRHVKLHGRSKADVAPDLKRVLGCESDSDAEAIADALLGKQAHGFVRYASDTWGVLRILEGFAILDLISGWAGLPDRPDKSLAKQLAALLALPAKPALDLDKKGLAQRAFPEGAAFGALVLARPWLAQAELDQEAATARTAGWTSDAAAFAKSTKAARACVASWKQAHAGDLALSATASKTALHAKAAWAAPAALLRLLRASAAKQDLIDPTAWQSRALAIVGTTLALGPLSAGLQRGPFKAGLKDNPALRECWHFASKAVLVGGWAGALGLLRGEAKTTPLFKLAIDGLQNAIVVLRDMYSPSSPSVLAHLVIGPKVAHAKLKDEIAKLYTDSYGKPSDLTISGRSVTIYRYLKEPLKGLSAAVGDLKAGGSSVTLSTRPWDLQWLLPQIGADGATPLPRTILAFAHADLGTLFANLARGARGSEAAALTALSKRADKLGANLSLKDKDTALSADLDLTLK